MGLKSGILLIAMRAGAQLAARGAHNPQVVDSRISSRRVHDAESLRVRKVLGSIPAAALLTWTPASR
jgi:hypothetical protein